MGGSGNMVEVEAPKKPEKAKEEGKEGEEEKKIITIEDVEADEHFILQLENEFKNDAKTDEPMLPTGDEQQEKVELVDHGLEDVD